VQGEEESGALEAARAAFRRRTEEWRAEAFGRDTATTQEERKVGGREGEGVGEQDGILG
jgi:hypothetical protein